MMMALWEMDARQEGIEIGMERGIEQGISVLIELCQDFQYSQEKTRGLLMKKFHLTLDIAESYIEKYWEE